MYEMFIGLKNGLAQTKLPLLPFHGQQIAISIHNLQ